ncbi:MAG: ExbD/TolR family protein [Bacteroidia bacterium]
MAEMVGGGGGGHKKGGPKSKKKSTRIDMTAMVDVAFLLLTFFVLTATMTNSNVMDMVLPPKIEGEKPPEVDVDQEKVITFVLEKDNKVKFWRGECSKDSVHETDYSSEGIRKIISTHMKKKVPLCTDSVTKQRIARGELDAKSCWDPLFVIKPKKACKYKNLVDVLDEMYINHAKKFAIAEFSEDDSLMMEGIKPTKK